MSLGPFQILKTVSSRTNHVLPAKLDRIRAELSGQFVHRALDTKTGLSDSIAPECSRRNGIGVNSIPVGLFVRATVKSDRFVQRMAKDFSAVIAVSPGIGNSSQINSGQSAVPFRAKFHSHLVRMPCGRTNKLFGTRKLPFHRPTQIQGGKGAQIFAQHLLFGAEAASDPFGINVHFIRKQTEEVSQLCFSQKRSLRTGPQMKPAILGQVRDRGMRFEMDMLLPVRFELAFVDNVSSGKSRFHVPIFAMDLAENVAAQDAGFASPHPCRREQVGAPGFIASSGSKTAGRTS